MLDAGNGCRLPGTMKTFDYSFEISNFVTVVHDEIYCYLRYLY